MAISLLGNDQYSGDASGSTLSGSYTCNAGSNRKLIVWVGGESTSGVTVNSVTYNGTALTKYQEDDGGFNCVAMFYLDESDFPSTPGAYTLEATYSASDVSPRIMQVAELAGASSGDPSAYEHQYLTSVTENNDTITTTADGSWILSCAAAGQNGTFTADSGQTLLNQVSAGGGGTSHAHSYESIASAGAEASDWNFSVTANRFLTSVCCIEPAATTAINIETGNLATGDGGTNITHTLTASDNRIVLVFVSDESESHPTGITYNGIAMTSVVQSTNTQALGNATSIWAIVDANLPEGAGSYTVAVSGMDAGAAVTVVEINNAAQNIPTGVRIDTNENLNSTSSTCTITAPSGDSTTFGAFCEGSGGLTLTQSGTDTTVRLYENDPSSSDGVGAYQHHTTSGSKNIVESSGSSWNRCSHAAANFSAYIPPVAQDDNAAIIGAHF
jgi:hypothetical protein